MEHLCKDYITDISNNSVWIFNEPCPFTKSYLLYVQEAGHFIAHSNYYTKQESIPSYLIMLTLSGKGIYTIDNTTYNLSPGDLVFVDSMIPHSHKTHQSTKNWEILWVQFNGICAHGYYTQCMTNSPRVIKTQENLQIPKFLKKLLAINKTRSVGNEIVSSQILTNLLTEILFCANSILSSKICIPDYIKIALSDIDLNFAKELNLEYFSEKLHISKYYFAKEFKKYTGYSPIDYIINTRLNHAKEYLKYSHLAVSDISEIVGFGSACHFISSFRQKVGITPLQFRKQYSHKSE